MNAPLAWADASRQHLLAALERVAAALERHAAGGPAAPATIGGPTPDTAGEQPSALEHVVQRFGLSPFERDVLVLAAGPELEGRFEALLASAPAGAGRAGPTFSLALAALPGAHWSAVTPAGPLRRWRLIDVGSSGGLMVGPLRIDERVLHFLVGTPHPDERLRGIVEPVNRAADLPPERAAAVGHLVRRWGAETVARTPVLALCGGGADLRRLLAAEIGEAMGCRVLAVRSDALPAAADERIDLLRILERECALSDALLLFERVDGSEERVSPRAFGQLLETLTVPVIVGGDHPPVVVGRGLLLEEVAPLSHAELLGAWHRALGDGAGDLNGTVELVADQFRPGLRGVAAIGAAWRSQARDTSDNAARLWSLCRAYTRPRLDGLVERIEPAATWANLVLPATQLETLRAIVVHVRQRAQVQRRWGFADGGGRGEGITALFAGPSGTGKTMAAEVLANELALDLYRIDLSQVVSKYIGETEKNLRRVFDAAEGGAALLLFDEADALFGKRSEVRDSHDRYANIEVSYLLQRMEAYHGLAILTTNIATVIDPAFFRRLRFSITFPFPDVAARGDIWRRVFPAATPTEGLEPQRLARLSVAGGNIRNIALHAAFVAADAGEPVRMSHLLRAARLEYAKLDRPLSETELGGWT